MRKISWKFTIMLVLLCACSLSLAKDRESIVVFGDSLSDSGNAFILTGELSRPPYQLIPDAAYARGGKHFSNGKTWIEQLAKRIHARKNAKPALKERKGFRNYAVGGARARGDNASFHLTTQVGLYLSDVNGQASEDTLYVIFIGGNDIRDAIEALAVDPAISAGILTAAVTALADNIAALTQAGARRFLIANAPNLALVPAINSAPHPIPFFSGVLSGEFNNGLAGALLQVKQALPFISITEFDVFGLIEAIVADPQAFGFEDVAMTCINIGVIKRPACRNPNKYLFWDGIHPTRAGHAELARVAGASLGLD